MSETQRLSQWSGAGRGRSRPPPAGTVPGGPAADDAFDDASLADGAADGVSAGVSAGQVTAPDVPAVVAAGVGVTYRVYAERKPSLRALLAGDRRQTRYRSVEAVKDASFVVDHGEAVGVIGHNGSGKSTLLRTIAGLLPVTAGSVHVQSVPVLLGVKAALLSDLSGRANVLLGGTAMGVPKAVLRERMDEIAAFAGVEEFMDLPLRAYSSGMKARLQFTIATVQTPEVLLIDEALSVGDAEFKERSDERIQEMLAEAKTVFVVSHSMRAITDICQRALWLDHGNLVADGPADEVVAAYTDHVERRKAARGKS